MYSELVVIDTTIVLAPLEKTIKIFHLLVNCWSQEDMQSCFLLRCLVNLTNRKRCSRRGRLVGEGGATYWRGAADKFRWNLVSVIISVLNTEHSLTVCLSLPHSEREGRTWQKNPEKMTSQHIWASDPVTERGNYIINFPIIAKYQIFGNKYRLQYFWACHHKGI